MVYPSSPMIEHMRGTFETTLPVACTIWYRPDEDEQGTDDFVALEDTVCDVEMVNLDDSPFNLTATDVSTNNLRQLTFPFDAPVRRGRQVRTAAEVYDLIDVSTDDSDPLGVVALAQKVGR